MSLSYKARRRWSLLILLVGLPIYIVLAMNLMVAIPRLPIWAEVPAYIVLAFAWLIPLRPVFRGIGQPDPDAKPAQKEKAKEDTPSA